MTTRIQVNPPKPFWDDSALSPTDFRSWLIRFTNWIELMDEQLTTKLTDKSKNCHLFQLLGEEGANQISKQPEMEEIETKMHAAFRQVVSNFFHNPPTSPQQDMIFLHACSWRTSLWMNTSPNYACSHRIANLGHRKKKSSPPWLS